MPRHDTIDINEGVWTEMTNADISAITYQNGGMSGIAVKATTGAAPTDLDGSIRYTMGEGEFNITLADLAPGIAATRVWAYATEGHARVSVSHG